MSHYASDYEYLVKKLDEEVEMVKGYLADNHVSGIEEYRRLCGVIQGLTLAKDIMKDLQKRRENDADE